MKNCEFCGELIGGFNKHRTSCNVCKEKYPFKASPEGGLPFNRKELVMNGVGDDNKRR